MELNPFKVSRNAAWYTLHKTGLNGIAQAAIHSFIPARQVKDLLQSQAERQKRREYNIIRGAGEIELQAQKGKVVLDKSAREQMWAAAKSGESGVKFSDVFHQHIADLLENTTPGGIQSEKVSRPEEF